MVVSLKVDHLSCFHESHTWWIETGLLSRDSWAKSRGGVAIRQVVVGWQDSAQASRRKTGTSVEEADILGRLNPPPPELVSSFREASSPSRSEAFAAASAADRFGTLGSFRTCVQQRYHSARQRLGRAAKAGKGTNGQERRYHSGIYLLPFGRAVRIHGRGLALRGARFHSLDHAPVQRSR
jgi:hypothetical protein